MMGEIVDSSGRGESGDDATDDNSVYAVVIYTDEKELDDYAYRSKSYAENRAATLQLEMGLHAWQTDIVEMELM